MKGGCSDRGGDEKEGGGELCIFLSLFQQFLFETYLTSFCKLGEDMTAHFQVFVADFFVHIGHDFLREQMQKHSKFKRGVRGVGEGQPNFKTSKIRGILSVKSFNAHLQGGWSSLSMAGFH